MNIFETKAQTTIIDTPVLPHNHKLLANEKNFLAVSVLPLSKEDYTKLMKLYFKEWEKKGFNISNSDIEKDHEAHTKVWTWELSFDPVEFVISKYNWEDYPKIKVNIIEGDRGIEKFPHYYSLPYIVKEYEVWFGMLFHWVKAQKKQYNIDVPIEFLFLEETFMDMYGSKYGFINPRKEEQEEIS